MEHLLLKAATTATTDQGTFEAVISSATIDREKDIVSPNGMVAALKRWVPTGKNIPLAWNHSSEPDKQIGYIDPATARAVGNEVWAKGWIDQSTETGRHAWRQVKAGTLGFSFGYLTLKAKARRGGGREITELDVFEITATPTPMNNDTRVVAWKSAKQTVVDAEGDTEDEDDPAELLGQMISLAQDFIDDEDDPEDVQTMRQVMGLLLELAGVEASEDDGKSILEQAQEIKRQFAAKNARPNLEVKLEALQTENAAQAEQLKTLQAELAQAKERLSTREKSGDVIEEAHGLSRQFAAKNAPSKIDVDHRELVAERDRQNELIQTLQQELDQTKKQLDARNETSPHHGQIAREVTAKRAKAQLELRSLTQQYAEQAEQLKTARDELTAIKQQLSERQADFDTLRRVSDAFTLEAVKSSRRRNSKDSQPGVDWVVPEDELAGAKAGALKAVWTTAYVNSLPDSCFLFIEAGGDKDGEGKTVPRTKRHFPYKDASGAIDLPHLRNVLSRIPQAEFLSQTQKDELTARAQRILDNQKALAVDPDVTVDATDRGQQSRSVDPLVQEAKAIALAFKSAGISQRKPPREKKEAPKRPEFNEDELRCEMRNLMVTALRGGM